MKRLFIAIAIGFTLLTGCKKDLVETPYGVFGELTTPANIDAATVGIYQAVENGGGIFQTNFFFPMVETGHRYSSYGSNGENIGNREFYRYIYTANTPAITNTWAALYRMVNRSNEVIEAAQANLKDSAVAVPLIAEARFLRGWAYFVLTQLYGPVPLHLKATATSTDQASIYLSRSPIDKVYEQIVADMEYAAGTYGNGTSRLPRTRPVAQLGRVTAGTALGMLGKVYLTMAGKPLNNTSAYTSAVNTLFSLISQKASYGTGLLPKGSFQQIFTVANEMNGEILFALRSYANATNIVSGSYFANVMAPIASSVDADMYTQTPNYGLRWDILRLFEPGDVRSKAGVGGAYPDMRSTSIITVNGAQVRDSLVYDTLTQFRYVRKSLPSSSPTPGTSRYGLGYTKYTADVGRATTNPRTYNNDWIILRYADVLLMYAEALNETGQTALAFAPLNEVRLRAGASAIAATTTQTVLRQIIRDERMRELVGEFTSVFDIRRWGTLKEEMDNYRADQLTVGDPTLPVFDPKFYLYPVPADQLIANPKLAPQNPGW